MLAASTSLSRGERKDAAIHIWDTDSGVLVRAHRGGVCGPRSLHVSRSLLLCGQASKPSVHCWLQSQEQLHLKMPLSDALSCLTATDSDYICAGGTASGALFIWEIATGNLLAARPAIHYRRITTVKFSSDGAYLITASEDGSVKVWSVVAMIQQNTKASLTGMKSPPLHTWSDHSLPVTDVYCGAIGVGSRVVTASKDRSCKLYELATGLLLRTFAFEDALLSVTFDAMERTLYAGASNGVVYKCEIEEEHKFNSSPHGYPAKMKTFAGHKGPVTCLAVSIDTCTLLSGSDDGTVRVWDTESRQCLRAYEHNDPVTNLVYIPEVWIKQAPKEPCGPISQFQRRPHVQDLSAMLVASPTLINLVDNHDDLPLKSHDDNTVLPEDGSSADDARARLSAAESEVEAWRKASEKLYKTASDILLKPPTVA